MKRVRNDSRLLFDACYHNDIALVKRLILEEHFEVNVVNDDGEIPFHIACQHGHIEIAEFLLAHGADLNEEDSDRFTPLEGACYYNCKEIVKLLIARGANVNEVDHDGWSPLHSMCFKGFTAIVKILIEHGADMNKKNKNKRGRTPFEVACANEHVDTIEFLIMCGVNISGNHVRYIYDFFGGEKQFTHHFTATYVLPPWRALCHGTMSLDSPLAALRDSRFIVYHICLLNTPPILRKQYPEKELH